MKINAKPLYYYIYLQILQLQLNEKTRRKKQTNIINENEIT